MQRTGTTVASFGSGCDRVVHRTRVKTWGRRRVNSSSGCPGPSGCLSLWSPTACFLSRVAQGLEEVPNCVYRLTLQEALSHWLPTGSQSYRPVLKSLPLTQRRWGFWGGRCLVWEQQHACALWLFSSMPLVCLLLSFLDSGEPCSTSQHVLPGLSFTTRGFRDLFS